MEYGVLGVCDLSAVWDGLLQEKKIQRDQTCCSLCCLQEMDGFCTVASSEKSSCVTVIYRKCSAGSSICFWPLAVTVSPRVTALLREMGSFIGNIRFKFSHSNTEFKIKPCQFPLFSSVCVGLLYVTRWILHYFVMYGCIFEIHFHDLLRAVICVTLFTKKFFCFCYIAGGCTLCISVLLWRKDLGLLNVEKQLVLHLSIGYSTMCWAVLAVISKKNIPNLSQCFK